MNRNRFLSFASLFTAAVSILLVCLSVGHATFAQVEAGVVSGTVRDSSGAVIPGATVTVTNAGTSVVHTVQTAADGGYVVPALPPGTYDVKVTNGNFQPYETKAEVTVGAHVIVDAQLSLQAQSTTVEVVAQGGVEVNTQTQEISQVVNPDEIMNLPSLTRNPYDFVALAGNVSSGDRGMASGNGQVADNGQNQTDRGVGYALNGQRASGTEVLLDGAENTNIFNTNIALYVPQDAVLEFRVITNNFDAQYGRASGGVINLVTKSGTNGFHGDAWEFNRLSAYTANTYANVINGVPKGIYTRNDFGYTIGGPAIKNKLFFFQSTEWLRVRSGANLQAYVPTPQLIAASAPNTQAFMKAFGGNLPFVSTLTKGQLPTVAYSGTYGSAFAALPASTPAFGLVSYIVPADAGGDEPQNTYNLVARVDYNFDPNTQMFFRYGRERLVEFSGSVANTPYPQYNVGQGLNDDNYLLSVNHNFSANLLSSTKLNFFRYNNPFTYNNALQTVPTLFLFNNASVLGTAINLPGFFDTTTGVGGLPSGGPLNSIQINEDLIMSKGTHTIRYGGQYNYLQMNEAFAAYAQANEQIGTNFSNGTNGFLNGTLTNFTAAVNPNGHFGCAAQPYSGTSRGALIQTPACTLTLPATSPSFARSDRYNDWGLYLEDSWRLKPRLTLNYGMRYEHYGVQHNNNQQLDSNFYYGAGSTFFQTVRTGTLQVAPNSPIGQLWAPRWGTAAPRVGFAYDLFGNGKTALRGGFGISYERNFGNVTFNVIQNPPNYQVITISGATNGGITNSNAGPLTGSGLSVPIPTGSNRNVDEHINVAQTQFWGLSIDHQLGGAGVLSLEYNGAHGVHLYDIKNINMLGGGQVYLGDPQTGCAPPGPCYTRPNQAFTNINNRGSEGFSHYNALNVRYQTQDLMKTGLTIVANYTWAHSLDNGSSTFSESSSSSNGIGNLGYLDPRNPALDYGNSDFDIRNRLALSPIWQTPWFKGGRGLERQLLGGYVISGIFTARSGVPFTISDSTNSLNAGTGPYGIPRYTPATAPATMTTGAATSVIGPNDFGILTLPKANSFTGLLGVSDFGPFPAAMTERNAFRGPGAWNFDLSLGKTFAVTERFKLEFRAEAYNIFNHHNMYVNGFDLDAVNFSGGPVIVDGEKGGLGNLANGGNHDERRFGQFALRLLF
ncbi:MAG: carboxypeptidase regulatory-like domain-containing protein [Candidatus Acidiferrales bacterium]|jgi:carboxypeptidase family protein